MHFEPRTRLAVVALIGVIVGGAAAMTILPHARTAILDGLGHDGHRPATTGVAQVGGPFTLTTQTGARVTDKDFRGRFLLVVFGYAADPDATPASLQAVTDTLRQLGESAGKFQPLFISLDPERDAPQKLAKFITRYDPRFIALTGARAEIERVAAAYFVHPTRKAATNRPGGYEIDYAALIYVMDRRGRYVTHFTFATPVADMLTRLRAIVR